MKNIKIITAILAAVIAASLLLSGGGILFSQEPEVIEEVNVEKPLSLIKTVSLTNADIRSVMLYLSAYSDINIVVSPQVEAEVSINLKNVTWRLAFDIIMETYGLIGVESKDYIRVVKAADYYSEKQALEKYNAEQATLKNLRTRIITVRSEEHTSELQSH